MRGFLRDPLENDPLTHHFKPKGRLGMHLTLHNPLHRFDKMSMSIFTQKYGKYIVIEC